MMVTHEMIVTHHNLCAKFPESGCVSDLSKVRRANSVTTRLLICYNPNQFKLFLLYILFAGYHLQIL